MLTRVGDTTSEGTLWRVAGFTPAAPAVVAPTRTSVAILIGQGVIVLLTLLLAIPTGRRRRVVTDSALPGDDPANTFDEDENG